MYNEKTNIKIRLGIIGSPRWVDYFIESFIKEEKFQIYRFSIISQQHNKLLKLKEIFKNFKKLDLVYIIYGWLGNSQILMVFLSLFLKIPILIHWIGTDVYTMTNSENLSLKIKFKRLVMKILFKLNKRCYHIACAPWLKDELFKVGINAAFIPVLSPMISMNSEIYQLPKTLTVLSYIPLGKEDFYGEYKLIELAKKNPDVKFIVVANSPERKPKDLSNVEYYGWVSREEMEELYKNSTCVLRLTKHDGLLGLGIEALLRGRYLIFIYEHPYVYKATTVEEAQKALDDIKIKTEPNYEGAKFVKESYSTEIIKERIKKLFFEILKRRTL